MFGLDIVLGALGMSLLPRIPLFEGAKAEGIFLKAVLLTGSNPLTIVFWGGVFSAGVASKNMDGKRIFLFGTGCASATLVFLNAVALAGSLVRTFLPQAIMTCLNVAVGIAVIIFAFQMAGLPGKSKR